MADGVGVIACIAISLTILNLAPGLEVPPLWQMFAVTILTTLNAVVWARMRVTPISLRQAGKVVALCALILTYMAAFDTLVGFIVSHKRTIPEAFINSGPFGGILDLFLFLGASLFGVPTLARAVCLYYRQRLIT